MPPEKSIYETYQQARDVLKQTIASYRRNGKRVPLLRIYKVGGNDGELRVSEVISVGCVLIVAGDGMAW